jgi:hypothetical protein
MVASVQAHRGAEAGVFFQKDSVMKSFAISLGLLAVLACSGCWRPYYGSRFGRQPYAQPAYAQPPFVQPGTGQPTYSAPVVQQGAPVVQGAPVETYPSAAPAYQTYQPYQQQQCVPCQPCCVPCY